MGAESAGVRERGMYARVVQWRVRPREHLKAGQSGERCSSFAGGRPACYAVSPARGGAAWEPAPGAVPGSSRGVDDRVRSPIAAAGAMRAGRGTMPSLRCFFTVMTAMALLLMLTAAVRAAERVALVIGNTAYEHTTALRNPRNDATDVARALEGLGFAVVEGLDLDKSAFGSKLREFAQAARGAQVTLFFYAGHGLQVEGENYLVPTDAKLADEVDLRLEAFELTAFCARCEAGRAWCFSMPAVTTHLRRVWPARWGRRAHRPSGVGSGGWTPEVGR